MRVVVAAVLLAGCASRTRTLDRAGGDRDDGHGELANASARWFHRPDDNAPVFDTHRHRRNEFGGGTYGGYVVPQWQYTNTSRLPHYSVKPNLAGAIEGAITWRGALPKKRTTACGAIEPVRVGADRGVADVLVYIERVAVGRPLAPDGRTAQVGGLVVKRDCALVPQVQIVAPLPASVMVHGDAHAQHLRVIAPAGEPRAIALQEGGHAALQIAPGVTRIDGEDGMLAAAWIVAVDTSYYAITDEHGRFRLDELAPGNYDVTIWQAPLPDAGSAALAYGAPTVIHRSVRVDNGKPARLDVVVGR